MENKFVCFRKRETLFTLLWAFSLWVYSQNITVTGTITDTWQQPVIGATIVVRDNPTKGTITDEDGRYVLYGVPGNAILMITYVGMKGQEILIGNRTVIDVIMAEDSELLGDLVVVGYGTQSKKDITGSVAVIDTESLLASSGSSAAQQLQGKTPGVYIGQTGSPGSATMVRIRGINTINDNGPLYVIDGVSTRNQNLSSLNPSDIESMQILKDASAGAIYGAQAANGVILITTKRGNASGPKLTYDAYYGIQKTAKRYSMLNSVDRVDIEWESQLNSFRLNDSDSQPKHAQFGEGSNWRIPKYLTTEGAKGADVSLDGYSFPNNQIVPFSDTDWWNEVDRVAPIQNHQLTLSGGSDRGRYLMGLNYFDQKGTVVYSYYTRYQTRLNTSFDLRPWLRFGENLQYSFSKDQGLDSNSAESNPYSWTYRSSPWVPVKDTFGNWGGSKLAGTGNWQNVVALQYRNKDNYYSNSRVFGNAWAEADLTKEIMFRTSFGLDYTNAYSYAINKKNLEYSESSGTNNLLERSDFNFRWVWTNTLTYSKTFNNIHSLNVVLGTEAIRDGLGRSLSGQRFNYLFEDDPNTWDLDLGENNNQRKNNSTYNGEFALFGVFARADYVYNNKYLLTGIVRRDGVSRFSRENRYGAFPSMSVGWRVSEEEFLANTRTWLDDLKLRFGYGHTGNAEIPRATNYIGLFTTKPDNTNYDLGGANSGSGLGYYQSTYGNADTRWEALKTTNIGIDATFGGGRFTTSLEFYNKLTTNMLIEAAYSALANNEIGKPFVNFGDMQNRGVDFAFNYRGWSGDWAWDVGINLSSYKNKVLRLSDADDFALWKGRGRFVTDITRTTKGRPISEFYGYKIIGFYENEQDVLQSPIPYGTDKAGIEDKPKSYVGKYKFADISGPDGVPDGVINSYDRTVIGSPHPDLIGGFNASLTYKNWDMTLFWYSTMGNDLFNGVKFFTDFPLFAGNRSTTMRDRSWKMGGDNSKAILPILDSSDSWGGAVASTYYVEDGSYLKLKNLVIGYSLPKKWLKRATIANLRLYVQGENLLTFTKYTGLDPEITNLETGSKDPGADLSRGQDAGGWPTTMRLLFGVNFEF